MNRSPAVCLSSASVPPGFAINPLCPTAAEIKGLDCARPMDARTSRALRQAFLIYPALIFRDQILSASELAAFGRLFGPLETYETPTAKIARPPLAFLHETSPRTTPDQMLYVHPEESGVLIMTNEALPELTAIAVIDNAECWHSDGSHKSEPYQAIAVQVLRNPASGGGDTEFCDLRLLYDTLPPGDKKLLAGLTATHHWSKSLNPRFAGTLDEAAQHEGARIAATIPQARQPVVRTHPETLRPALYVSPRFTLCIDGAAPDASKAILNEIFALMDDPRFCYRHQWRERDLMIWDNRCLNHRVLAYAANDIRRRHRITIGGDRPYYRRPDSVCSDRTDSNPYPFRCVSRNVPALRIASRPSLSMKPNRCQTCGMFGQISRRVETSAAPAHSASRVASSSRISAEPT